MHLCQGVVRHGPNLSPSQRFTVRYPTAAFCAHMEAGCLLSGLQDASNSVAEVLPAEQQDTTAPAATSAPADVAGPNAVRRIFRTHELHQAHLPQDHPTIAGLDRTGITKIMQRRFQARCNIACGIAGVKVDLPRSKGRVLKVEFSKCCNYVAVISSCQVVVSTVQDGKPVWQKPFDADLVQGNLEVYDGQFLWDVCYGRHTIFQDGHFGEERLLILSFFQEVVGYPLGCLTLVHLDARTGDKLQHLYLSVQDLHRDLAQKDWGFVSSAAFSPSGGLMAVTVRGLQHDEEAMLVLMGPSPGQSSLLHLQDGRFVHLSGRGEIISTDFNRAASVFLYNDLRRCPLLTAALSLRTGLWMRSPQMSASWLS
ncbi:hypothetical protein WJX73_004792 [Symbiochloris irregularis]|uniref:Uncharacterized protein n=1 Tax=Symbiochloris irregularis TaxID=706552 RepID=A0AAW1NNM6_9CHLO